MRLHWLAIGITLIVTFSTFGYPLLFDRLYIGLLAVTALVSVNWDKNLLTICFIGICSLLVEETAWQLISGGRQLWFELAVYVYLLFACYINRYSLTGKMSVVLTAISIVAEGYWLIIGRDGPELFWYLFICANSLIVKHVILIRPHYCSLKFPKYYDDWRITKTDIDLGYLLSARIALEYFNIAEYLTRHIFDYPLMLVYDNYNVIGHALLALTFYIYIRSFTETLKTKLFPA